MKLLRPGAPRLAVVCLAVTLVADHVLAQRAAPGAYFPERFDWQTRTPEQAGVDAAKLDAAIKFAVANENPNDQGSRRPTSRRRSDASRSTRRSAR